MSYDMIDRFLRNNLGDDDYAEYSAALDSLCTPQPKQEQRSVSEHLGEPVAWMNDSTPSGIFARHIEGAKNFGCTIPLYTTPQPAQKPWVGLTDEEINDLVHSHDDFAGLWEFADSVEAKLNEKNT